MHRLAWVLLVLMIACGSGEGVGGHGVTVMGEPGEEPTIALPDGDPPTELVTDDLREGDGSVVEEGMRVVVNYIGVSWTRKASFDSSWRSTPFPVEIGAGRVIAGWEQGLVGMRVGGRRLLIIPPELAYGERGAGEGIPPGDTLVFVVDVLEAS